MLEGVIVEPLKVIQDERGDVRHMLRCDSPIFKKFGEIYFSSVNPGFIKGWKKHSKMTQHFAVVSGDLKLVLFDGRRNSSTKNQIQEIEFGENNYQLVRIPPEIWYSFSALSDRKALIANCTDLPHDPTESMQLDISDPTIPYKWNKIKK